MTQPHEAIDTAAVAARVAANWRPSARYLAIGAVIAVAVLLPAVATNFVIFQLTLCMIYGLAILGLNLLTGFNGQFSLGHSAFYGIGAYTAAILMDKIDLAYYWTLPSSGALCFASQWQRRCRRS